MTGTIKTLKENGFGFIAREGEAKDLFFHSKELNGVVFDDLKVGDIVIADQVLTGLEKWDCHEGWRVRLTSP